MIVFKFLSSTIVRVPLFISGTTIFLQSLCRIILVFCTVNGKLAVSQYIATFWHKIDTDIVIIN
jgi:hypothetical protein